MELNQTIFSNNQNSYFRFYTKMSLNSLFKMFLAMFKSLQIKKEKLQTISSTDVNEIQHLKKDMLETKRSAEYLYKQIRYILDYPERIKIISLPIRGILQEYKKIEEKNRSNQLVQQNLKSMFSNIKYKLSLKKEMPFEYSSKKMDNEIFQQKKKIKELENLIQKFTNKKQSTDEKGIIDKIFQFLSVDCEDSEDLQDMSQEKLKRMIEQLQQQDQQEDQQDEDQQDQKQKESELDPITSYLLSLSYNN